MSRALHEQDPTGRFSNRAADYAASRPSYPAAAVDAVVPTGARVAVDLGAGTGIFSNLLGDRGLRVYAVEPNPNMRAQAPPHQNVTWVDGSAERLSLHASSADLVTCAQAFHWFQPAAALEEIAKVLRPGGRLALIWNVRDRADPFTSGYSSVVDGPQTDWKQAWESTLPVVVHDLRFEQLRASAFVYAHAMTRDGLLRRARSASYLPPERWPEVEAQLLKWFDYYARGGKVVMRYRTEVFLAERT